MKAHWRYLVARYGAYPIVWCLAGEMDMPAYDSARKEAEREELKAGWLEVGEYLRQIDPYHHPITAHQNSFRWTEPRTAVDLDMLQTGHSYPSIERGVRGVLERVDLQPRLPVLVGEVCYEGEYGSNWQDIQRFFFWTSMMSGTCGHTYGASGIWQFITKTEFFVGIRAYGDATWDEAMQLPGSRQLGISKGLLERYRWWEFEARQEPEWDASGRISPLRPGFLAKCGLFIWQGKPLTVSIGV